jgi:hypothetical protein
MSPSSGHSILDPERTSPVIDFFPGSPNELDLSSVHPLRYIYRLSPSKKLMKIAIEYCTL